MSEGKGVRNPSVSKLRLLDGNRDAPPALHHHLIQTARALLERNLVLGSVGNVSARVPGGFLITPTRLPYSKMRPEDLVGIDLDGATIGSGMGPSLEWRLHCAIYNARADVSAIVHTHSIHATAWSFLSEPLEPRLEESLYYDIGTIRTSPRAPAGSHELGEGAIRALGQSRAALLRNHGVLAVGETLDQALVLAEVVEREAHVAWLLRRA
jgi:ribulose-5-phosphate 4-epimerase/fuculose-1-phosphate aldolase